MGGPKLEKNLFDNAEPVPFAGCFIWMHGTDHRGYGRVLYKGRLSVAHRVAWEIMFGAIPKGMFVCHSCDTPSCINPRHLFLGTNSDNQRQKAGIRKLSGHTVRRDILTVGRI